MHWPLSRTSVRDPSNELLDPCVPPRVTPDAWVLVVWLLVAVAVWGELQDPSPVPFAVDIAVGVVACALVPAMFRRPVPGALALAVLAVVSPAATPPATVGTLHVSRQRTFAVAAAVAVAGVVAHAVRGWWRPEGISFGWWLLLVVLAHATLLGWGALNRTRSALIIALEERARRAEAEQGRRVAEARAAERTQIAREMHDVLAHRLSLLATYAGAMEYRPDTSPERLSQAAGVIRSGVHDALDELRDVIAVLRDDTDNLAVDRPQPVLTDVPDLIAESRAVGLHLDLQDRLSDADRMPPATGRTAYRIVQEGLTNARKHAAGQPVAVALEGSPDSGLSIEVSNPAPERAEHDEIPGSGSGLVGLTERARLAGGRLDHHFDGRSFRLSAWLPWPA